MDVRTGEFLRLFVLTYEAYHNHKETAAYTIAVVQAGAAGVLLIADLPSSLQHISHPAMKGLFLALLFAAGLGGWLLIRLQLRLRAAASAYVVAGWNLLARETPPALQWVPAPPQNTRLDTPQWPEALKAEIDAVRPAVTGAARLRWLGGLVLSIVAALSLAAIARCLFILWPCLVEYS